MKNKVKVKLPKKELVKELYEVAHYLIRLSFRYNDTSMIDRAIEIIGSNEVNLYMADYITNDNDENN